MGTPVTKADPPAPRITPAVGWFVALNVAVYFVQLTLFTPADVQQALAFQLHQLGRQWWTIGTYMFVHPGFGMFALNLYTLWLFGPRVEHRWNTGEFVRYYLFCGIGGWFAHLVFAGGESPLMGASAAVFGVMLAYAIRWPEERVYLFGVIPARARWLVVAVGALTLMAGMATGDAPAGVAYLAQLGGVAAGWLYLRTSMAVNLDRLRQGVSPVPDEPDDLPPRAVPRALPRTRARDRDSIDDVLSRSNAAVAQPTVSHAPPREPKSAATALDKVLDKISAHGIESLSPEEQSLLDEASRRLRGP